MQNTIRWLTLVLLLISAENLISFAQDEHTVLLYTFETGVGKTVKDLSGNNNDGELMGPKWGEGNPGGGLVFEGNGPRHFVEIPDSDSLDLVSVETSFRITRSCGSAGVQVHS